MTLLRFCCAPVGLRVGYADVIVQPLGLVLRRCPVYRGGRNGPHVMLSGWPEPKQEGDELDGYIARTSLDNARAFSAAVLQLLERQHPDALGAVEATAA